MEEIRKVAEANGEEDRDTVFHTFQQLGMALQKGNAAIFVCRMETVYKMVNRGEVKLARKSRIKNNYWNQTSKCVTALYLQQNGIKPPIVIHFVIKTYPPVDNIENQKINRNPVDMLIRSKIDSM